MATQLPTFYLSHGGGPWPYMTGPMRTQHAPLEASLKDVPRQIGGKPKAILVVSGHWEETDFAVMANPAPPMFYDFGGFPEETYKVRYSAPGAPALAKDAAALIKNAGLRTHLDYERGFDHGTYSLLAVTHPEADIPVIQVSIRSDYDPEAHVQLGRTLAPLREDGVLIIGSGSSYHNMQAFRGHGRNNPAQESAIFDTWLKETLVDASPQERIERLLHWERAPHAREVHPQEDHFMPLHVAVGAAEAEAGKVVLHDPNFFGGFTLSSYQFGLRRQAGHL
jgi:aromatic ring-opening dioxygenase catalytic subunit (LigB family)